MPAIFLTLGRFLLTAAGGWLVSDVYNEYQTSSQVGAMAGNPVQRSFSRNALLWIGVIVGVIIALVINWKFDIKAKK